MVAEAEAADDAERERECHRHVGDFTLFWTGVYPEALGQLRRTNSPDALINYQEQGRRSYYVASRLSSGSFMSSVFVSTGISATNMDELVHLAKAQPGKLNFASAGVGGLPHLAGELFKLTAKIDIVHVPYRGAAPAINDLLGQQVQMAFLDVPVILPQIKAGTLRPIALGARERDATAPDAPTTGEVGMPDLLIQNWYGMVAPAATPPAIVATLNRITREAMSDPSVKQKMAEQGLTLAGNTPEEFRAYIASETKRWAKVIKDAGVETTR